MENSLVIYSVCASNMNSIPSERKCQLLLNALRHLSPGRGPFQSVLLGRLGKQNASLFSWKHGLDLLLVPNFIPLCPVPPIEAIGIEVVPMNRSGPPRNICHLRATTCNSMSKKWKYENMNQYSSGTSCISNGFHHPWACHPNRCYQLYPWKRILGNDWWLQKMAWVPQNDGQDVLLQSDLWVHPPTVLHILEEKKES